MNRFIRWGRNALAMIPVLPAIIILALILDVPNAVQPVPIVELEGERYVVVARNHPAIKCSDSEFRHTTAQLDDPLWEQVIRVANLPTAISTRNDCAECHHDACNAWTEHLTDRSKDVKANHLTLNNFLSLGQYAPLLTK